MNENNNNIQPKQKKDQKISFFSAVLIVIGSTIGAGIFFRSQEVLNDSYGSLILSIFAWLLAASSVIFMALALLEITSRSSNNNLSILSWIKQFNSRKFYLASKAYMAYIYSPLTFFFLPYYAIQTFQDGVQAIVPDYNGITGTDGDWVILMIFGLIIVFYFFIVNSISIKFGNFQNWIISLVKFFPLTFAFLLGFIILIYKNGVLPETTGAGFVNVPEYTGNNASLSALSPGFGLFLAVGAIFFSYDGFYVSSGIMKDLKEPKKAPRAIFLGLAIITIVYLAIAIASSVGSDGSPRGFQEFLAEKNLNWLYAIFQFTIAISILGIINGFSIWVVRLYTDLINQKELAFYKHFINRFNRFENLKGCVYGLIISVPLIVLFTILGRYVYFNESGYDAYYGMGIAALYSFCDLMAIWTSALVFALIVGVLFGGIKNRKTNKVEVDKIKHFLLYSYIAITLISLALFFVFFEPVVNVFLIFRADASSASFLQEVLLPRLVKLLVLIAFLGLMSASVWYDNYLNKKNQISNNKQINALEHKHETELISHSA